MKASDIYGAQLIKLDTFTETISSITGRITAVERRQFKDGDRLVVILDHEWSLVINATSYRVIRARYGDETDNWKGQPLTVYKGTVFYQGNEQEGICVRIPEDKEPALVSVPKIDTVNAELREAAATELEDDIRF